MDTLSNRLRQRELKERNQTYSLIYDKLFEEQIREEFVLSGINVDTTIALDQLCKIWIEAIQEKKLKRVGWEAEWNYILISYWPLHRGLENNIFTFEATTDHIYFGEFSTEDAEYRIRRPDKVLKHVAQNDPIIRDYLVQLTLEEEKTILFLSEHPVH